MGTGIDLNLTQVSHGLAPELVKALGQALSQLTIAHQERGEAAFLDDVYASRRRISATPALLLLRNHAKRDRAQWIRQDLAVRAGVANEERD